MPAADPERLKFGLEAEKKVAAMLAPLGYQKTSPYHPYDFHNKLKNCYIELKTRRISSTAYRDTLIPLSKIKYIEDDTTGARFAFLFVFTDGRYFIRYDKAKFDTFARRNGGVDNVPHIFIPVSELLPLS